MEKFNAIKLAEPEKEGDLDTVPLDDFIPIIEKEIFDEEIDEGKDSSEYLKNFIAKKETILSSIEDEKRKKIAAGLFGTKEILIRDDIERETGEKSEELRIMDTKWQQEIISYINGNPDRKELESFWTEYDSLFRYYGHSSTARGEKLKAGILGELAVFKFLTNHGFKVFKSTPEDDVLSMIDLITYDEKNKNNFLIQVKVRNRKVKKMAQKAGVDNYSENIPYFDFEKEEIAKVFDEDQFKTPGAEIKDGNDYDKFRAGCFRYTKEHQNDFKEMNRKGYKTRGLYLYVPYSVGGERTMDIDGRPGPDFINTLMGGRIEEKLGIAKIK